MMICAPGGTEASSSWAGTVNGAFSLTVNTTGSTRFGGAVGGTTALTGLTTNDGGTRNYANTETLRCYAGVVFSIGDSYTEGVGNLTDESYPFYLDLLLNETGGGYQKRFAVYNLGLGAYGSIQSARIVNRYITALGRAPDVIVYLCQGKPDSGKELECQFPAL